MSTTYDERLAKLAVTSRILEKRWNTSSKKEERLEYLERFLKMVNMASEAFQA